MGFFTNNTRKLIQQLRRTSQDYSTALSRDISEMLSDLKSDYEESSAVIPEFQAYINELKQRLDNKDAVLLDDFSRRIARLNRSARKGVEAMWELSNTHRKTAAQSLSELEAFE